MNSFLVQPGKKASWEKVKYFKILVVVAVVFLKYEKEKEIGRKVDHWQWFRGLA